MVAISSMAKGLGHSLTSLVGKRQQGVVDRAQGVWIQTWTCSCPAYVTLDKSLRGSGPVSSSLQGRQAPWALSVWICQGSKCRSWGKGRVKSITINGIQVLMVLQGALQAGQGDLLLHVFTSCLLSTSSGPGTC